MCYTFKIFLVRNDLDSFSSMLALTLKVEDIFQTSGYNYKLQEFEILLKDC